MEQNKIKQLLVKFYEGMTSPDEEKILKDYFRKETVFPGLEADKELFMYMAAESKKTFIIYGFEDKISDLIDQQERSGRDKTSRRASWGYIITGIAAGLLILITCYVHMFKPVKYKGCKDTYNNPQVAYLETRRILFYISKQLNKGTEPLSNMNMINEGVSRMSVFSSFVNGIEPLGLVSKYSNRLDNENNKTK